MYPPFLQVNLTRCRRLHYTKVNQNCVHTPYKAIYLVTYLPKTLYIHREYIWFWPTLHYIHPPDGMISESRVLTFMTQFKGTCTMALADLTIQGSIYTIRYKATWSVPY